MTDQKNDLKNKKCEPPFWENISVIFDDFSLQYKPTCEHSKWNFVFRLFLLSLFVGLIAMLIMLVRTSRARSFGHKQATTTIVVSYYWHFVDIVWIALFSAIYLIK